MREVIEEVIKAYGGISSVQKRFGYTEPMGVYNWRFRGIPKSLVAEIHVDTGIDIQRINLGVGLVTAPETTTP